MESALGRVLAASLRTFLFQSRGWVAAPASSRNRGGVTQNAIYSLKPCLPLCEQDREAKSRRDDRAARPARPTCHCLLSQTAWESSPPCCGVIPGTEIALPPPGSHTPESLRALMLWCDPRHGDPSPTTGKPHSREPLSTLAVHSLPTTLPVRFPRRHSASQPYGATVG